MYKSAGIVTIAVALSLISLISFGETKHADKAGSWYPKKKEELYLMLDGYLNGADPKKLDGRVIGIISPHASYVYSGRTAAYGYKSVMNDPIDTVIIVGFNHAFRHEGIAVCDCQAYETPLGSVKIDNGLSGEFINEHEKIYPLKKAFYDEQSTEMQVPFIQMVFKDASIVVLSIGMQTLENVKILAEALYQVLRNKDNYLIVASTDMCHFLQYDENNRVDDMTIKRIKNFDADKLYDISKARGHRLMCGYGAVTASMIACKKLGADRIEIIKHENSGDVSGNKHRVVGYLSAAFVKTGDQDRVTKKNERKKDMLSEEQKKNMLKLARDSINYYLENGKKLDVKVDDAILNSEMGAFVTLHKNGQLRGCIGNIVGQGPFYLTVRDMAIQSATKDPRFRPVKPDEMKEIDIEISALSELEKIDDPNIIEAGKHGVLVSQGFRRGVYLPQVATQMGWDRDEFLNSLCGHKAGMKPDAWKTGKCDIFVFTATVFGEKSHDGSEER